MEGYHSKNSIFCVLTHSKNVPIMTKCMAGPIIFAAELVIWAISKKLPIQKWQIYWFLHGDPLRGSLWGWPNSMDEFYTKNHWLDWSTLREKKKLCTLMYIYMKASPCSLYVRVTFFAVIKTQTVFFIFSRCFRFICEIMVQNLRHR